MALDLLTTSTDTRPPSRRPLTRRPTSRQSFLRRSLTRRAALTAALATAVTAASGQSLGPRFTSLAGPVPAAAATQLLWLSGAGDDKASEIANGGFGLWRGEPTTYARIWADASLRDMTGVWMMDAYKTAGWTGTLDIACGGPREGQTWATAATGGMDATWRATCQAVLAKWGKLTCVHLSMSHELNGNWYPWSITTANVDSFKIAWTRWYTIVQQELVAKGKNVKVVLCMNSDTTGGVSVQRISPAPAYYDILGVDFYSMWPDLTTQTIWDQSKNAIRSDGSPRGIQAWFNYARAIGKPLSFPEWGTNAQKVSDNPFFIQKMREIFAANGSALPNAPAAGKLAGEAYFNATSNCRIWPSTVLPNASAAYKTLTFGS